MPINFFINLLPISTMKTYFFFENLIKVYINLKTFCNTYLGNEITQQLSKRYCIQIEFIAHFYAFQSFYEKNIVPTLRLYVKSKLYNHHTFYVARRLPKIMTIAVKLNETFNINNFLFTFCFVEKIFL